MDLNKFLNQVEDKATEQVKEGLKGGLNEGFENGTYIGVLIKNELRESGNGKPGVMQLFTVLESEDPKNIGENYMVWNDLERDDAFKYLTWGYKAFKVTINDPSDLINELRRNPSDPFDLVEAKTVVKFLLSPFTRKDGTEGQNFKVKNVIEDYDFDSVATVDNTGTEAGDNYVDNSSSDDAVEDGPTPQIGMKITFNYVSGVGKKAETKAGSGEIISIDEDAETITVKEEGGNEREIPGNDVTGLVEESPVE